MTNSWLVQDVCNSAVKALSARFGLDPIVSRCMVNRDLTGDDVPQFLDMDGYEPPDPFQMPDMALAVERLHNAITQGEHICIYGDYDADGVTAIAILMKTIHALGGTSFHYVPDRFFEGIGLNCDRIKQLQEDGVSLVITVDTGSRAFDEMTFARQIGMDVIVTDHHTPSHRRPDALAVLNPKMPQSNYPFRHLCGAGVAFKLAQGLAQTGHGRVPLRKLVTIAAIGTIADMVPLIGENRWIVSRGLSLINREDRGPIRSLLRKVGIRGKADSLDISFRVAPRINAPGRLGDPDLAIRFFEDGPIRDTQRVIEIMDGMNHVRQLLEKELTERLDHQLNAILAKPLPSFVLLAGRNWHRGILGIIACKMLRRLNRAVCILSYGSELAHGSIRAPHGVDVMGPLGELSSLLTSFGGHSEAAGICLQITNIPQFKLRMNEVMDGVTFEQQKPGNGIQIDAEIEWAHVNPTLLGKLSRLEPFGTGNPLPRFLTRNLILETELIRKGPWYHFEVSDGALQKRCSFYHPDDMSEPFEQFDSVDLIYSLTSFKESFQVQVHEMVMSHN